MAMPQTIHPSSFERLSTGARDLLVFMAFVLLLFLFLPETLAVDAPRLNLYPRNESVN
jgi:hypothetical protein